MTKSQIKQYRDIRREISLLQIDIADVGKVRQAIALYGDPEWLVVTDLPIDGYVSDNTLSLMKDRLQRLELAAEETVSFLQGIGDSRLKASFHLRYVRGMEWMPIASRTGYADQDSVRMACKRYLRKQGIK